MAIICGILFLLLAVFRLGFLANFLSKPILIGFVAGLALDIMVSQIAKMLGVTIDSGGEFAEKVVGLVGGLGTLNGWSALISAGSLLVLLGGRRLLPAVPWALVVLVLATVMLVVTDLGSRGVAVLGEVPAGPPSLTWPVIEWSMWLTLIPSAIALTMVATAEGLLVSRAYGEMRLYPTRPNRDLFAFGLGNILAGVQGSFAVGSSTSRTAAMDQAGSRTQLPSIVLAAGTLLLLLFGTALLADIPSPAIGAIVAVAIIPLLGIRDFMALWRLDRFEFGIGAVCFLVTLFVGSIAGIVVAFVLALINLARRAANPAIDVLAADGDPAESLLDAAPTGLLTAPGVIVIRMAAPLFFANGDVFAQSVKRAIEAAPRGSVRHLIVDLEAVTDVDVTAAESFAALRDWLRSKDVTISFSRMRADVAPRLTRLGILTGGRMFRTNRAAVAALSEGPEGERLEG